MPAHGFILEDHGGGKVDLRHVKSVETYERVDLSLRYRIKYIYPCATTHLGYRTEEARNADLKVIRNYLSAAKPPEPPGGYVQDSWANQDQPPKQQEQEKKPKMNILETLKREYSKHEDVLFPLFIVVILDHFFNNGGLRQRIVQLTESLLDSVQTKLLPKPKTDDNG